ncbi:hypothetical protein HOI83_03090 [Candidatus Uhrbacteria bacterium]|jgi:hypothetical protein|nr:hypothetical protein [Candidatus Uhrbacteria bacterium]
MSERPPQRDPSESAPQDGPDASAEAWEHHIDNAEKEEDVEKAAAKEKAAADTVAVDTDDESAAAWENYIEGEEKEERIAHAKKELKLAAEAKEKEGKKTKKTGGGGGGGKAMSYGPLGMKGGGIGYSERRERGRARETYNFLDRRAADVESVFKFIQEKFAALSFSWLPFAKPKDVDRTPAIDPKFDKPEGKGK